MATPLLHSPDPASPALDAYEALAPFYDDFTADYAHRAWLDRIQALAAAHGVSRGRLLDLACGTGKSSGPMQQAGWEVWACDLSPAMIRAARMRLRVGPRRCFVADIGELPPLGRFDLVLCLDDSLNYLTYDGQLSRALASCVEVLAPTGLLVFDLNTLHTYRTVFASEFSRAGDLADYTWRGLGDGSAQAGQHFSAQVEVRPHAGGPAVVRQHQQRHHSRRAVGRGGSVRRSAGSDLSWPVHRRPTTCRRR